MVDDYGTLWLQKILFSVVSTVVSLCGIEILNEIIFATVIQSLQFFFFSTLALEIIPFQHLSLKK